MTTPNDTAMTEQIRTEYRIDVCMPDAPDAYDWQRGWVKVNVSPKPLTMQQAVDAAYGVQDRYLASSFKWAHTAEVRVVKVHTVIEQTVQFALTKSMGR